MTPLALYNKKYKTSFKDVNKAARQFASKDKDEKLSFIFDVLPKATEQILSSLCFQQYL